nr:hypothetical protein [Mycoplasmopsis agalactiae]
MKAKKYLRRHLFIAPLFIAAPLISAKCGNYEPSTKVLYDLHRLKLESVEDESLELIKNYENKLSNFWSDRQALRALNKVTEQVKQIENKAEQELKEYVEDSNSTVEQEDSEEKDSSVLTAKKL